MSVVLRLPEVLTGMEEATLTSWHVEVGQEVRAGQPLADVETEKATVEYVAEASGIVADYLVELEQSVTVGTPIVLLATDGESVDDAKSGGSNAPAAADTATRPGTTSSADAKEIDPAIEPEAQGSPEANRPQETTQPALGSPTSNQEPHPNSISGRLKATPLVRRLAKQHGIDLSTVPGTGPAGRIVRRDVDRLVAEDIGAPNRKVETDPPTQTAPRSPGKAGTVNHQTTLGDTPDDTFPYASTAATATQESSSGGTSIPHTKMRRAIARRLSESKSTIPHFYLTAHCRVDALLELRERVNAETDTKVSVNDFVVKAVAGAMREVPAMNAKWTDTELVRYETVDVAVAVALDNGLVTPVLRDVESQSVSSISRAVKDMAARARSGRLRQDELEGGAFSISNLGMYGTEEFAAIINPPHSGILAVGAATQRPVVTAGVIEVGTVMTVTLSGDHRIVDGATGAQWLAAFVRRIESPLQTLI